jgi:hypothetical protein
MDTPAGRSLWAALHLLDHQIMDSDGLPAAKVDDLEFSCEPSNDLPVLENILCGAAAWTRRQNPRLGRAVELLRRVIRPTAEPGPSRIGFGTVKSIGPELDIDVAAETLDVTIVERWLSRHIVSHIPGSGIKPRDSA